MNNSVAAAAVSCGEVKSSQIPDKASIFTAELIALNLALDIVCHIFRLCLVCLLFRTCKLNLDTL